MNLARAYGRKGDVDKAITHLEAAKAEGLADFGEVEKDPKLGSLRQDPRYARATK